MKILSIILLTPILVFGQHDKLKYKPIDSDQLSRAETNTDQCSYGMFKVTLMYAGDGQKITSDKGHLANERLKKCKLKTKNPDWRTGSTEIRFRDKKGNDYWIYSDNEGLNFHDWTTDKEYLLYLRILDGKEKLFFLDEIELMPGK